jgi:hypothetical protein
MKQLIIVAVVGYSAWWIYENKWSYSDSSLALQAEAINKIVPMRMSSEITLNSVEAKPGKTMVYNAEFFMPSRLLPPNTAEMLNSDKTRKDIAGALCKEKIVAKWLKHGARLVFSISAKDGEPITDITFTGDDCP